MSSLLNMSEYGRVGKLHSCMSLKNKTIQKLIFWLVPDESGLAVSSSGGFSIHNLAGLIQDRLFELQISFIWIKNKCFLLLHVESKRVYEEQDL